MGVWGWTCLRCVGFSMMWVAHAPEAVGGQRTGLGHGRLLAWASVPWRVTPFPFHRTDSWAGGHVLKTFK